jgi:hypothetical protein
MLKKFLQLSFKKIISLVACFACLSVKKYVVIENRTLLISVEILILLFLAFAEPLSATHPDWTKLPKRGRSSKS